MLTLLAKVLAADDITYPSVTLGFQIPKFNDILTFILRFFFIVAGLVAIIYLLLGALAWITSGGNKESVDKAREKITAALVGIIILFVVLAVIALIESVFFPACCGLGITKPLVFPGLIQQ
jgi:hypothetical protein